MNFKPPWIVTWAVPMIAVDFLPSEKRFTLERCWEHAKHLLLMHTVQRPPFSVATFSLADLQIITQYLLHTYFKHYKLYQYAFCPTYIVDLEMIDDIDFPEMPPPVPALNVAQTEEEREAQLLNLQRQLEELEKKIKESEAHAREAAIAASIEAAYRASIPDEITEAANDAVTKHMEKMRTDIEEKLQATEEKITSKFLDSPDFKATAATDSTKTTTKSGLAGALAEDVNKASGKDSSSNNPSAEEKQGRLARKDDKKPPKGGPK